MSLSSIESTVEATSFHRTSRHAQKADQALSIRKLSIIIPCYNEAATIVDILDKVIDVALVPGIEKEIVLVNDCSVDETHLLIKEYIAETPRVPINYVRHSTNQGKGAAIQTGLRQATGDYVLIQDADLEYDPKEYNLLLQPILSGHADIVYGSRFKGGQPHRILFFWHTLGNKLLTLINNLLTNMNLTDAHTCYKLMRTETLRSIPLLEKRFAFDAELNIKISRIPKARIYEVGISYYGRTFAEGKKIRLRDAFRSIYCLIKYSLFPGTGHKRHLLWVAGLSAGLFVIFKIFYPFPDFFSDSYFYIFAAKENLDVSIWPIGYSKFLAVFHVITHSDTALVAFQYILMQISLVILFFTMRRYFDLSQKMTRIIFIFFFVNPLSLYLCNTINSDALFIALSILWLSTLISIIKNPKAYKILVHAVLLFLCFTIRNNAYYYPIVGTIAFLLTREKLWFKAAGIVLPVLFCISFIIHTREAAFRLTGIRQFSFFTGWQLANNALYLYPSLTIDSSTLPTAESRELNRIYAYAFRKADPGGLQHHLENYVGNFFVREQASPLKQFFARHYSYKNETEYVANWGKASAVFEPFGKSVILQHPLSYIKHFVYPNTWYYFIPPLSHLQEYNYGVNKIDPIAAEWFDFKSTTVRVASYRFQGILILYTTLFLVLNVYFLYLLIDVARMAFLKILKIKDLSILLLSCSFLIFNFGFSITTTMNILRYQVVPMVLLAFSSAILYEYQKSFTYYKQIKTKNTPSNTYVFHA